MLVCRWALFEGYSPPFWYMSTRSFSFTTIIPLKSKITIGQYVTLLNSSEFINSLNIHATGIGYKRRSQRNQSSLYRSSNNWSTRTNNYSVYPLRKVKKRRNKSIKTAYRKHDETLPNSSWLKFTYWRFIHHKKTKNKNYYILLLYIICICSFFSSSEFPTLSSLFKTFIRDFLSHCNWR